MLKEMTVGQRNKIKGWLSACSPNYLLKNSFDDIMSARQTGTNTMKIW